MGFGKRKTVDAQGQIRRLSIRGLKRSMPLHALPKRGFNNFSKKIQQSLGAAIQQQLMRNGTQQHVDAAAFEAQGRVRS